MSVLRLCGSPLLAACAVAAIAAAPLSAGSPRQSGPADKRRALHDALYDRTRAALERIAGDLDGVMGYAIVDLANGDRFDRLADEPFPTASTIKLAVLYELFKRADEGDVRLDQERRLDRASVVGGAGVLQELGAPILTLGDYATLMVMLSDNTATNVLIDVLGMGRITGRMASLGLPGTRLRRRMIDLDAARRGEENVSTPAELARLLGILHRGEGLRPASRDALIAMLKKPNGSAMRRAIPPGVGVASKPGELEGVRVDAGIVMVPGRPYAFAAATTYLADGAAGETAITEASRAAYLYFSRLAAGGEYGRQIGR